MVPDGPALVWQAASDLTPLCRATGGGWRRVISEMRIEGAEPLLGSDFYCLTLSALGL